MTPDACMCVYVGVYIYFFVFFFGFMGDCSIDNTLVKMTTEMRRAVTWLVYL